MGLRAIAERGVETIFSVFSEAVKEAQYVINYDDGWGTTSSSSIDVRLIVDKFSQKDIETSSFSELIQPTDVKGLVPGKDVTEEMMSSQTIQTNDRVMTIVAFDTDAFSVLYTLLLRDV